ncbi:MAG: Fic family protein [Bacteroidota bacterium]|nr:Fic family protein [Bacteroidota bacterium]
MRPLPADVEGKVMQKLRLDWNYHSNAIEGNKLSYGETVAFLMEGITAKGKPLKDHLDIRGHNEAINFLLAIVKDTRPISEADIRALHKMILVEPYDVKAQTTDGSPTTKRINLGEYKTSANHVQTATGETHYYATPEETPAKMQELMEWYAEVSNHTDIHPVVAAALFHHRFVSIHPFDDGNGRLSRILMNLILMQKGYPPVVIKMDDRLNYYSLLSQADNGNSWPFVEYVIRLVELSNKLYLRALKGENIIEEQDLDKEIALLRMELKTKVSTDRKNNKSDKYDLIFKIVIPFIERLSAKISVFDEFFKYVILSIDDPFDDDDANFVNFLFIDDQNIQRNLKELIIEKGNVQILKLIVQFKGFKNPEYNLSISEVLFFFFDEEGYSVNTPKNDLYMHKTYNEKLTTADQNLIIKVLVKNIKYWIKYDLKSGS